MRTFHSRLAPLLAAFVLAAFTAAGASGPYPLLHSLFSPLPRAQPDLWQGESVAATEDFVVVGVPHADVGSTDSGVVKVYDAFTSALLYTLLDPAPAASNYFGMAVAASKSRVVVGAPFDDTGAVNAGNVYVYDLASATPTLPVVTLLNPTLYPDDQFGTAVAISGTRVVVGVAEASQEAGSIGSALVYDLASATPAVAVATLSNPTPLTREFFGTSVAISGTKVVVGAYGERTVTDFVGAAYVYELASASPGVPVFTLTNPTPVVNDYFGVSVGISDSRVIIGARFDGTAGPSTGSAYLYDLAGAAPTVPVFTLTNPTAVYADSFGVSVAIWGTRAVVAAHRDDTGTNDAGSAYVYDLTSGTPLVPALTLTNPTPGSGDTFGRSVSIAGDRVVVGAPKDDTGAVDAGSAYLYDLAGAVPAVPIATLNATTAIPGDQCGTAVAVSGTRVVVGSPRDDTGALNTGSVQVYDLASATPTVAWIVLTNPGPMVDDWFGAAVAISGTRVVVGAYQADTGAANSGMVYVYDLARALPAVPVVMLTNPSPAVADFFGYAVGVSGSRVVVGAPRDDGGATDTGRAYVYDMASATPGLPTATLTNPGPAIGDLFGSAVAISGMRVVVGTPFDDTGALNAGTAYVYDLASATPTVPAVTLPDPSPAAFDNFGNSVAISGGRVVIGAPKKDTGATDAGSAYVYDLTSATPASPLITLTNPSPVANDLFGSAVAISGTRIVIGAYFTDTGAANAGSAYVYDLATAIPAVPVATLANPTPAAGDNFGFSVAIDGTTVVAGAPFDDTSAVDRGAAYVFGSPLTLKFLPAIPGMATLSWTPTNAPGFVLQYADALAPTNWSNAPSGAANPVTIATTNAARFYRVAQP